MTRATHVLSRRLRHVGGNLIRRLRLLPEGEPDGLSDDAAVLAGPLPFRVMLYFADTERNLYQLRQWYRPLRRLNERHPVGIVCLDSRTAQTIRAECADLPVVCVGRVAALEAMVARSDVALALYVNHNVRNLHPLRFATMMHAYLGHGESDKAASASNQVKAYDFVLVPGEAGRERLRRSLMQYDVAAHVRLVGRPQLDRDAVATPAESRSHGRVTVLYAPTWEGAQPSMAYSSVLSHGRALLTGLLADGRYDVVYRPHPRLGANQADFAVADRELRELVSRHATQDSGARHRVDVSPAWQVTDEPADVLVSDISAVAADWLSTGKPLLVTVPADPAARVEAGGVLDVAVAVPADAAADIGALVDEARRADPSARTEWIARLLGDTSPGAATRAFLATCDDLVALRERELDARRGTVAGSQR